MSSITKVWTEEKIRNIIRKLDEKTGLNGADLPIHFKTGGALGCYNRLEPKSFGFKLPFFNDPNTLESECIDTIRHEYAHYIVDAAELELYIYHSNGESSHGDDWKYACKMVRANPNRCHDPKAFRYRDWDSIEADRAANAEDIPYFDILGYINKHHCVPLDDELSNKILGRMKNRNPKRYFDVGEKIFHHQRGFGTVTNVKPRNAWVPRIFVRFEDNTTSEYGPKEICKVVNGTIIPINKNEPIFGQMSIDDLLRTAE